MRRVIPIAAAAALIALPAAAHAGYPPASDPGQSPRGSGNPGQRVTVCKRGCRYRTIQSAVNAVGPNSTIRVRNGTYREGVIVRGRRKNGLKLIGNARRPSAVVLDGRGVRGAAGQNGVRVDRADRVQVRGFKAQRFKGNGFFFTFSDDYSMRNLEATRSGAYGLYAFNTRGGEVLDSEAWYFNDAGLYIGQTPPQARPKRTLVKGVKMWGNVQGYSGQNSRYVTLTDSDWYNNGIGISMTSRDSEKYTPEEQNTISGNRVFWNNFNVYKGRPPFERPDNEFAGEFRFPVGIGIFIYGGFDNRFEDNQIFGNWLAGVAAINSLEVRPRRCQGCKPESEILKRNRVTGNVFGKGGADLNGRDIVYPGQGVGNCFTPNAGAVTNFPADDATLTCPGPAEPNNEPPDALGELIGFSGATGGDAEVGWIRHPHEPIPGIRPIERGR